MKKFPAFVFAALALVFLQAPLFAAGLVKQSIDTTDAMATLDNFDRGFYTPQVLHLKPSGGKPIEKPYGKLLHLRAEISEFSSNAWLSSGLPLRPALQQGMPRLQEEYPESPRCR